MRFVVGIDRGTFDLAIGSFRHLPDRFMTCHLLSDEHVCVMRAGHPEAQVSLSLEKYLAADHLLLSMSSSRSDEVDEPPASRDLARRIVMRVPHALAAVIALLRSDMLASMTRGAAHIFGELSRRCVSSYHFQFPLPNFGWFGIDDLITAPVILGYGEDLWPSQVRRHWLTTIRKFTIAYVPNARPANVQTCGAICGCYSACNFDPLSWGIGVQN